MLPGGLGKVDEGKTSKSFPSRWFQSCKEALIVDQELETARRPKMGLGCKKEFPATVLVNKTEDREGPFLAPSSSSHLFPFVPGGREESPSSSLSLRTLLFHLEEEGRKRRKRRIFSPGEEPFQRSSQERRIAFSVSLLWRPWEKWGK